MLASFEVRRAMEADLPALSALLLRYFTEEDIQQRDDAATLLADLQSPVLGWFVAETPAGIAGCVLGRVLPVFPGAAECKRLYAAAEARGRGIASRLMDTLEAEARAQGFRSMYLDSKDSFAVAMALYTKRGYEECARYNDNREATVFFRKQLV